ncbi:uncharacterized protein LOC118500956 [Phyllostomus discolor]|uniref:Uncharacterized protein LOC118500956 n=1 Tax=Phyllostomus discolor TaxID=89673 RepID=A0A7E6DWY6_9CHIR|nr:uncharacterized protein LOC118500956 [Phyllostomus discolor]
MASWFDGLSSSLGCYLGPMSHSVVSLTRHISRCTKDVWMVESKTEESNELKRKEVETTKETMRPKVGRFMTFYSDNDLENKQKTAAYNDLLIKGDLDIKLFIGKETLETQKLQNLREDTESVNAAAGFVPATFSTLLGGNIDPKASEYKHELKQKNLEIMILRERHEIMYHKLLKLQKATESTNVTSSLVTATPASISLGDNINHSASEYEHQLKQQNLEMKILRGRNVAMKHKLLKLQKATQCLSVAAGLLPAMSLASLGENIDPNDSEYKHKLEQKNLEVKILRGRNVAMKHKLLKLQKATQCLNAAAGLLPATSSASLGENIDPNDSEYEHALEQKNLEVKILRGRNVAMKHKLLKLWKATQCLNVAAGLEPAIPASTSLGDNIDHSAPECKNQLQQQNLEMKILRGRNIAMQHKLLKLQKAIQCLSVAVGLLPATSAPLGENIHPKDSEHNNEFEQKNLEMKILRERHEAMKRKLLKLHNANQSINVSAGLIPAMPAPTFLGDNIDPNASECEHQLELKNVNHPASSTYQHLQNRMTWWIWSKEQNVTFFSWKHSTRDMKHLDSPGKSEVAKNDPSSLQEILQLQHSIVNVTSYVKLSQVPILKQNWYFLLTAITLSLTSIIALSSVNLNEMKTVKLLV